MAGLNALDIENSLLQSESKKIKNPNLRDPLSSQLLCCLIHSLDVKINTSTSKAITLAFVSFSKNQIGCKILPSKAIFRNKFKKTTFFFFTNLSPRHQTLSKSCGRSKVKEIDVTKIFHFLVSRKREFYRKQSFEINLKKNHVFFLQTPHHQKLSLIEIMWTIKSEEN